MLREPIDALMGAPPPLEETRVPRRVHALDDPRSVLSFAVEEARRGGAALATLVEIRGGAARALGAQVAIAADGRYCGYVSGGCVEAALAQEALQAMREGRDRVVAFGEGSPFFDLPLPCGGGITIAIHVLRHEVPLRNVLRDVDERRASALCYDPTAEAISRLEDVPPRSRWREDRFTTVYRPRTRVIVSGQPSEAEAVCRLADASGYDVQRVDAASPTPKASIDACTAVVLLHHDLDAEARVLEMALRSPAFYIGALGSTRTHHRRVARLRADGMASESVERIKAPIGLFGPTRDATSLALSVLADIAAARLASFA